MLCRIPVWKQKRGSGDKTHLILLQRLAWAPSSLAPVIIGSPAHFGDGEAAWDSWLSSFLGLEIAWRRGVEDKTRTEMLSLDSRLPWLLGQGHCFIGTPKPPMISWDKNVVCYDLYAAVKNRIAAEVVLRVISSPTWLWRIEDQSQCVSSMQSSGIQASSIFYFFLF